MFLGYCFNHKAPSPLQSESSHLPILTASCLLWGFTISGASRAMIGPALSDCQEGALTFQNLTSPEEAFQRECLRRRSLCWLCTCILPSAPSCVIYRSREEILPRDCPNQHAVQCESEMTWVTPTCGAAGHWAGWNRLDPDCSDRPACSVTCKSSKRALAGGVFVGDI